MKRIAVLNSGYEVELTEQEYDILEERFLRGLPRPLKFESGGLLKATEVAMIKIIPDEPEETAVDKAKKVLKKTKDK